MWYRVSIHWVIVIIGMHMEDYMWSTTYCNLKERVLKTQRTDCLQRTQASMFSWVTRIQLRPPKTQHTTYLLTLSDKRHEIEGMQAFSSYTITEQDFDGFISCLTHSHKYQQGKLSCCITDSVHSRKHKLAFRLRCSQKRQIPSTLWALSLSLQFSCSSLTDC